MLRHCHGPLLSLC